MSITKQYLSLYIFYRVYPLFQLAIISSVVQFLKKNILYGKCVVTKSTGIEERAGERYIYI